MKIETKYNIGDEVWFMLGNRTRKATIHSISVLCYNKDSIYPHYKVELANGKKYSKNEYHLYKNKKELLKSL